MIEIDGGVRVGKVGNGREEKCKAIINKIITFWPKLDTHM